jgi:hypothetical protein
MRFQSTVCLGFATAVFGIFTYARVAPVAAAGPTFAKDGAPIPYKNCTSCQYTGLLFSPVTPPIPASAAVVR